MRTACVALIVAGLVGAGGCSGGGSSGPVAVYPTAGQILLDGQPAVGVRVSLIPIDAPSPPQIPQYPHGVTDEQGRFRLTTFQDNDGAPEGGWQVVLDGSKKNSVDNVGSEATNDTDIFQGWYDVMHSNLKLRVTPQGDKEHVFKLPKVKGPPGLSEGIPGRN